MRKISILMVVIFAVLALVGCGSKPAGVAKVFLMAIEKQDFSTAKMYVSKDSKAVLELMQGFLDKLTEEQKNELGNMKFVVKDAQITGDTAIVNYERSNSENSDNMDEKILNMVKEEGQWKVVLEESFFLD